MDFRLHDGTMKLLRDEKKKSGLTWNRFIYKILTFYLKNRNK
jgi:hypothetical protein